ncbi:MAG: hypothetical protein ACKVQW_01145 [Pyrinomonadaceae bacterium]
MIQVLNASAIPSERLDLLKQEVSKHSGLKQVLAWAGEKPKEHFAPQIVAEVITQDEFTHDVIVPYQDVFLVYDTT